MKEMLENLLGFIYSLSMGDYFFFIGTFLLIVLFIYILYLIKSGDEEKAAVKEDETFDLEKVTKDIEQNYKPETIKLTSYEEEQENNAIISYDELVKTRELKKVSYDDEYTYEIPELKVKKFDLNTISNTVIDEPKLDVQLMSYEKEEEFLKTLKKLQSNLSR